MNFQCNHLNFDTSIKKIFITPQSTHTNSNLRKIIAIFEKIFVSKMYQHIQTVDKDLNLIKLIFYTLSHLLFLGQFFKLKYFYIIDQIVGER